MGDTLTLPPKDHIDYRPWDFMYLFPSKQQNKQWTPWNCAGFSMFSQHFQTQPRGHMAVSENGYSQIAEIAMVMRKKMLSGLFSTCSENGCLWMFMVQSQFLVLELESRETAFFSNHLQAEILHGTTVASTEVHPSELRLSLAPDGAGDSFGASTRADSERCHWGASCVGTFFPLKLL